MIKAKGRCISRGLWPVLVVSLIVSGCNKDDGKGAVRTKDANGVETVLNGPEPYKINGKAVSLALEREMSIDTENEAVIKTGLGKILAFDADQRGNIYILVDKGYPNFIFKFDPQGRFLGSFARMGQGPGELQAPNKKSFRVLSDGTVVVVDQMSARQCIYDGTGKVIRDTVLKSRENSVMPLENGSELAVTSFLTFDPGSEVGSEEKACVRDGSLAGPREMDKVVSENIINVSRFKAVYSELSWDISKNRIVVGNPDRDYEVRVFDLQGRPVRIIRKDHPPLPVPEDYKKEFLKTYELPQLSELKKKIYFPDSMPPYDYIFADEDGRVFVVTYEKGPNEDERMCDVFDPEGVFVARVGLPAPDEYLSYVGRSVAEGGLLYCLREKANDFEELIVYRMMWK